MWHRILQTTFAQWGAPPCLYSDFADQTSNMGILSIKHMVADNLTGNDG